MGKVAPTCFRMRCSPDPTDQSLDDGGDDLRGETNGRLDTSVRGVEEWGLEKHPTADRSPSSHLLLVFDRRTGRFDLPSDVDSVPPSNVSSFEHRTAKSTTGNDTGNERLTFVDVSRSPFHSSFSLCRKEITLTSSLDHWTTMTMRSNNFDSALLSVLEDESAFGYFTHRDSDDSSAASFTTATTMSMVLDDPLSPAIESPPQAFVDDTLRETAPHFDILHVPWLSDISLLLWHSKLQSPGDCCSKNAVQRIQDVPQSLPTLHLRPTRSISPHSMSVLHSPRRRDAASEAAVS